MIPFSDKRYQIIYTDPSPEIIRQYIEQQSCWICGKGGWKSLSQHLFKKHGLHAAEVREMAYMCKGESLISKELLEVFSESALRRFGDKIHHSVKGDRYPKYKLSTKARDILKSRIKEMQPLAASSQKKRRKPHCCQVCGKVIETSQPRYCPECWRIAIGRATKKAMTPERVAHFKAIRRPPTPAEQSRISKEYWRKFKELPSEVQRKLNLKKAASRRVRIYKNCVICGAIFDVIHSQADRLVTCGRTECVRENRRIKATGRRHTPESIAKMSIHAKERHINEPLFGRKIGVMR